MDNLTSKQAFLAMYIFLNTENKTCSNEMDVNQVLSDCTILEDGGTADPVMWQLWYEAVEKARDDKNWEIARFQILPK